MQTHTQNFTNQSALEALMALREYLVSTGDLTKGYELAFERVIHRLSAKATKERLSLYGTAISNQRTT